MEELADALKKVLANAYTMYHTAKGYHWNVEGILFSQYHEFFDEIAGDVYGSIDPIAENIRKIGEYSPFKMAEFETMKTVLGPQDVPNSPAAMTSSLLGINQGLLDSLNAAFGQANAANEQGIANFLAERIDMHEKWRWQLSASLKATIQ